MKELIYIWRSNEGADGRISMSSSYWPFNSKGVASEEKNLGTRLLTVSLQIRHPPPPPCDQQYFPSHNPFRACLASFFLDISKMASKRSERAPRKVDVEEAEEEDDMTKIEFETSEGVEVIPTFDGIGLREDLLRGIYAYGLYNRLFDTRTRELEETLERFAK